MINKKLTSHINNYKNNYNNYKNVIIYMCRYTYI